MTINRSHESLDDLLREVLPWIDESLEKCGTPMHRRPWEAARIFVEVWVEEIDGDTKDGYLLKPWFGGIFGPISRWYKERYGPAIIEAKLATVCGLVQYLGAFYLLEIPLTISRSLDDETASLTFPKEVLEYEDPLCWIEKPPPLDKIPSKRKSKLSVSTTSVANQLRAIHNDLNTASFKKRELRAMADTVIRHLDKAARDTVTEGSTSLATWELQMACEKTIKAYLSQREIDYPPTHDLRELCDLVLHDPELHGARSLIPSLPSSRQITAWRYSELPSPLPLETYRLYGVTLALCSLFASRMRRKFVFNNFTVQLRRPAWRCD